jgi:hypothetical protein
MLLQTLQSLTLSSKINTLKPQKNIMKVKYDKEQDIRYFIEEIKKEGVMIRG